MFSRDPFFKQPKIERQLILLEDYSFQCQCEACINNYPLFHSLKSIDKELLKFVKKRDGRLYFRNNYEKATIITTKKSVKFNDN